MRKIAMYTNFLNHHQLPFCLRMHKLTDGGFTFVTQKAIATKRIGTYEIMDGNYPFLLKTYENENNLQKAYDIALEADVVIFGSSKIEYIKKRLNSKMITFRCSERLFKEKKNIKEIIRNIYIIISRHGKYNNCPLYMLACSSYTAHDFNMLKVYTNKVYKWGYFPESKKYSIDELIKKKDGSILYAGRLIDWKHPEMVIEVAKKLKERNKTFVINIIGQGEMENTLKQMIIDFSLEDNVNLLGSMSPDKVRSYMEKASIFMVTSDYNEGWGAVVNEAMNSGCVCVCSHAVGATGFLIRHNSNGLVYKYGDINSAYDCVSEIIDNHQKQIELGKQAYKTIDELWNADVAAKRFLVLSEKLKKGEDTPFNDGPCSKAKSISDRQMYDYLVSGKTL